ncbi:diacylglycerol kinase (ATP) [Filimonas zeae]|uniref:Diacylglycerol kinase n=1 Tax=Filimonas zeae TaxID=1737353 RepID=A0A917MVB9_9BACT|nr:diacylglycerol kinase family protein [Filimonas zeae]MDR6338847.1 diacylglycerol kinase (ATP) [Filimonas zeae]GGH66313.1 diacylglycerol kinase [Filimonas zeae]
MKPFSWKARLKSFVFSWAGIVTFVTTEHNAWIHFAATIAVVTAGFLFHISPMEWIAICGCITLVWVAEMVNTAIEKIMNHLSPERSDAVKDIKDIASGAVLVAAVFAVITGLIVFIPKL